jgi:hypothetical protein
VRQFRRRELRASCLQELSNPDVLASQDESPHEHFARIERMEAVRALVESLPARYREVVMLHELEDLSLQETAERLRCSVPAVKSRLFRGRSMLLARCSEITERAPQKDNQTTADSTFDLSSQKPNKSSPHSLCLTGQRSKESSRWHIKV